jgi:Flp pilus assembly pilin Flp
MKKTLRRKQGQGMVEYIIIVAVIALAAIAIIGVFGDTLRAKFGGAVSELGGDESARDAALETSSEDFIRNMDAEGAGN